MNLARNHLLRRIAILAGGHFRLILWGSLALALLSAGWLARLDFQSDVANLLPARAPVTASFLQFLKEFGAADSLFIVLERGSGGEVASFEPFAETLAAELARTGEFKEIQGRLDGAARDQVAELFMHKGLLYLQEKDWQDLEARLSDAAIGERVRNLKARLNSPLGSFASAMAAADPLGLLPLFQPYIPFEGEGDSRGIFLSPDRSMMLLIGKPKGTAPNIAYDERLLRRVEEAARRAQATFARSKNVDPADYFADLRIGYAGGFASALEDSRMIKKELGMNFTVTLAAVLLLFGLAFRRRISFLYALFPLAVSPLLTLGLLAPFLGRISEVTGAFSAIILGLSIDFIILLYSRYQEERQDGRAVPEALGTTLERTGPGIFTGAVTTTASYYALLCSDFRGVQELGLLTGTGILLSLACAFFLLPALIAWREGKERGGPSPFRPVSAFGLERLAVLARRFPALTILLCLAATAGALAGAFKVKMNSDPKHLRPPGQPSLVLEERIRQKMEEGLETIILLDEARAPAEALEIQGILQEKFFAARTAGLPVARFETLASFIPALSKQKRNLTCLESGEKDIFDPGRIERRFKEELARAGLREEPFAPGLQFLRGMVANRQLLTWELFQGSALRDAGERFMKKRGDAWVSAAYLHVKPEFWLHPEAGKFLRELKAVHPGLQATGAKLVQGELERLMSANSKRVLLIALAGVFLLIYLDFRSLRMTVLSLLPVLLASLWTLGLMGVLGMPLHFMNLVVFTMVLGVGVDYGVHLLHRAAEAEGDWEKGLAQVGKGVVLAALTTLAGFGSLIFSSYPGLSSMGAVALTGVGFSALIALTLVPVLLKKDAKR